MRTTRAFIAGLGTTGSLVAAAVCLLVVVGAVVAFNGWPGAGLGNPIDKLVVNDAPNAPAPLGRTGPTAVATGATAAAATVAPAPTGPPVVGGPRTGGTGPGGGGGGGPLGGGTAPRGTTPTGGGSTGGGG